MNKDSLLTTADSLKQTAEISNSLESKSKLLTDIFSLVILMTAVAALAFSPILTKLSEIEISPTATIFNRLWIATIIMSSWQLFQKPTKYPTSLATEYLSENKRKSLLILASILATISSLLWAISFTQTSVASSTVLRSLTPLFISLGAWLILKQHFKGQFLVGMVIAILGGIIIGWGDLHLGTESLIGDGIALLSAALHGANILTVGYLRDRGCETSTVLFWRCSFGALIMLPFVYLADIQMFPMTLQGWSMVIALAIVCQTFGQGLLVFSLKHFSSSFVGIFTLLKPILTAFLAWLIFAEDLSLTSGIAVILILMGIYLAKSSD